MTTAISNAQKRKAQAQQRQEAKQGTVAQQETTTAQKAEQEANQEARKGTVQDLELALEVAREDVKGWDKHVEWDRKNGFPTETSRKLLAKSVQRARLIENMLAKARKGDVLSSEELATLDSFYNEQLNYKYLAEDWKAFREQGQKAKTEVSYSKNDSWKMNSFGLAEYSEDERNRILRDPKNRFAETETDIIDFINGNVVNRNKPYARLHCGAISSELGSRIQRDTGHDLTGASLVIDSYFENSHSDTKKEQSRGQQAITPEIVAKLPNAIANYEKVFYDGKVSDGRDAFRFIVDIDGEKRAVEYYSKSRNLLTLQTMYGWNNKKNLSVTSDAKAPDRTSKTTNGLGSFNKSLAENKQDVNKNFSLNDNTGNRNYQAELYELQRKRTAILEADEAYRKAEEQRKQATTFSERVEASRALKEAKAKIDTIEIDQRISELRELITAARDEKYQRHRREQEQYADAKTAGYSAEPDTRLKSLDSAYEKAVNDGNMVEAERLVNQAAEAAMPKSVVRDKSGKLLRVYHYTNNDFTVFDRSRARTGNEMDGFFFAVDPDSTKEYGDRQISAYLNITNLAVDPVLDREFDDSGELLRKKLASQGYDGVARTENGEIYEYMVFDPEQIKSADPVVYDDDGNVIPLSERFNKQKTDIRFSLNDSFRTDQAIRKVLGKAVEGIIGASRVGGGFALRTLWVATGFARGRPKKRHSRFRRPAFPVTLFCYPVSLGDEVELFLKVGFSTGGVEAKAQVFVEGVEELSVGGDAQQVVVVVAEDRF